MGQSLARNLIHLVYSTKNREPWIVEEIRENLYAYQAGIFKDCQSQAMIIAGVADHVHARGGPATCWLGAGGTRSLTIGSPIREASEWQSQRRAVEDTIAGREPCNGMDCGR